MADNNDDSINNYDHSEEVWVEVETEVEPMELPEDHPAAAQDSGKEDSAREDEAEPDAPEEAMKTLLHQEMMVVIQMKSQS